MGGPGVSEHVRTMFGQIARRYDVANTALSGGRHHQWRRRLVALAQPPKGGKILDVATGTGDLAFEFRRTVGGKGEIVGVDFSEPMLERGREKAEAKGLAVTFRAADALALPFAPGTFDIASIAFGIRNVDDPAKCLAEMARVVRPGGRVAVLEFGQPDGLLKAPYWLYSRLVMPVVGWALTGHLRAYQYLPRTAARFPSGNAFVEMMESTGQFVSIRSVRMNGGIVYAYVGVVGPRRPT